MIKEIVDGGDSLPLEDGRYLVFIAEMGSNGALIDTNIRCIEVVDDNETDNILMVLNLWRTPWVITGITKLKD